MGNLLDSVQFISYVLKDLIVPLMTVTMVLVSILIGWKKGIFEIKRKPEKDEPGTIVQGDGNVIYVTPSQLQSLAYDATKFNDYHHQSISQSRISFWFSLIFATVGFLIIATSIFTYSDKTGYLGIVAGTIIDAVSALFFVQSNKARQLMSEFFDRLRQDRKLEESLKLSDSIDDKFLRNAVKTKLSLFFSGLEDSHNIASEIIRLAKGGSPQGEVKPEVPHQSHDKSNLGEPALAGEINLPSASRNS